MAAKKLLYSITVLPENNPQTLVQFLGGTNTRLVLNRIDIMPLGATSATAPLQFDLATQGDVGGLIDGDSFWSKEIPACAEDVLSHAFKADAPVGAEPGTPTSYYPISAHQQATRVWTPPSPIIITAGQRLGFRYVSAVFASTDLLFYFEE
jgi:hypothetical protein